MNSSRELHIEMHTNVSKKSEVHIRMHTNADLYMRDPILVVMFVLCQMWLVYLMAAFL